MEQKDCPWYCKREKRCHANSCPDLWGGAIEVPCTHDKKK